MEEDSSMPEKILRSIETIFNTDSQLKEFSIIPTINNTRNRTPVLHQEHNLGLESWCIEHVYRYAYRKLFEYRPLLRRKKNLDYSCNINRLLIGALLINPNVTTFWNIKRELIECDTLNLEDELTFSKIVISHKCKSNDAFTYRRWILSKLIEKNQANQETLFTILRNEFEFCKMAINKAKNNYHAWTHRIWCMDNIANSLARIDTVIVNELTFIGEWLCCHVSEHSGYHYRQYLIEHLKRNRNVGVVYAVYYKFVIEHLGIINENDPRNILLFLLGKQKFYGETLEESTKYVNYFCLLLFDLFHTFNQLNSSFPNHESLWYYRRYLLYNLVKSSFEYYGLPFHSNVKIEDVQKHYNDNFVNIDSLHCNDSGEKQPKLFKGQTDIIKSSFLYKILIVNESKCIKENSLCNHAIRYEKWLKLFLNFQE